MPRLVGVRVERALLRLPPGVEVGSTECLLNPTDCCEGSGSIDASDYIEVDVVTNVCASSGESAGGSEGGLVAEYTRILLPLGTEILSTSCVAVGADCCQDDLSGDEPCIECEANPTATAVWTWNGLVWEETEPCPSGCHSNPPLVNGDFPGHDVSVQCCQSEVSVEPSGEASAVDCGVYTSLWQWDTGVWVMISSDCPEGCAPVTPDPPGEFEGAFLETTCLPE